MQAATERRHWAAAEVQRREEAGGFVNRRHRLVYLFEAVQKTKSLSNPSILFVHFLGPVYHRLHPGPINYPHSLFPLVEVLHLGCPLEF
jgi:hypothetical protein